MESPLLNQAEKAQLLAYARKVVTAATAGYPIPSADVCPDAFKTRCGAFVSLHIGKRLRGCIGTFRQNLPLWQVVRDMACAAALADNRFPPVSRDEVANLNVEISVLTPMVPVADFGAITVGVHGLYVSQNGRSGVLLPQVPVQYGWNREQFLAQTCVKAGLPESAWKRGAEVFTFTALVFSEGEVHG